MFAFQNEESTNNQVDVELWSCLILGQRLLVPFLKMLILKYKNLVVLNSYTCWNENFSILPCGLFVFGAYAKSGSTYQSWWKEELLK